MLFVAEDADLYYLLNYFIKLNVMVAFASLMVDPVSLFNFSLIFHP